MESSSIAIEILEDEINNGALDNDIITAINSILKSRKRLRNVQSLHIYKKKSKIYKKQSECNIITHKRRS